MGKGRDKRRKAKRRDEVCAGRPALFGGGESFGSSLDPYAAVPAPLKPKPSLRSGAIALPQPEVADPFLPEPAVARFSK